MLYYQRKQMRKTEILEGFKESFHLVGRKQP